MICKNCGAEIPASAKFCDVCGTPVIREVGTRVKKEKVRVNWKLLIPILGLISLLIVGPLMISHSIQKENEQKTEKTVSARVTPEQFNEIEIGMDYGEVKNIVGSEGVKSYHDSRVVEFTWPGEYHGKLDATDPKLRVSFNKSTGLAETIEEVNILDGKEIYENEKSNKEAVTKLTRQELGTIPGEASYETICEMLGCDGVLTYSMSSNEGTYKIYEWRYLSKEDNEYKTFSLSFVDNRLYRY